MARSLGAALKEARERAGLSQGAVARRAGLAPAVLSKIEAGKRRDLRFATVARLAAALDLSLDALAFEAGHAPNPRPEESVLPGLTALAIDLREAEAASLTIQRTLARHARRLEAYLRRRRSHRVPVPK